MRSPILIITCATECLLRAACIPTHAKLAELHRTFEGQEFVRCGGNCTTIASFYIWPKVIRLLDPKGIENYIDFLERKVLFIALHIASNIQQYVICLVSIVLVFKNYSKIWMKILYIYVINYTLILHVNIVNK